MAANRNAPKLKGAANCTLANCGKEAGCQRQDDGSYLCICTHDFSVMPADGKCPRIVVQVTPSPIPYRNALRTEHAQMIYAPTKVVPQPSVEENGQDSATVTWLVPSLILGLLVLIGLLVFYRRRWRFRRSHNNNKINKSNIPMMPVPLTKTVLLQDRFTANPDYWPSDPPSENDASALQSFVIIQPEWIHLIQEIGEGCFGKVYKGQLKRVPADGQEANADDEEQQLVAVKVLKAGSDCHAREDLLHEAEIMASFQHRNILSLRGIVINDSSIGPWMVFEYMPYGDLAQLLRSANSNFSKKPSPFQFNQDDLHSIASQIADGMAYLSSQHFVHRDLACRNCLVGHELTVKISDFGMSRDVYTCDYYKIGGSRMLPVRWMAPESIMYGKFTLESDVWSFGVTLWEIYALGTQPYFGHSNEQVLKLILQNVLLTPPTLAPPLICHLLHGCWKTQPSDRLTFQQICERLNQKQKTVDSPLSINYIDISHDKTDDDGYQRPNPRPIAFYPSPFVAQNDEYLQPLPDIPVAIHQYTNSPPMEMLSD